MNKKALINLLRYHVFSAHCQASTAQDMSFTLEMHNRLTDNGTPERKIRITNLYYNQFLIRKLSGINLCQIFKRL